MAKAKTALKPKYEVEYVGLVSVETGRVIIGDPCYLTRQDPEPFPGMVRNTSHDITYEECSEAGLGTSCRLDDLTPEDRAQIQAGGLNNEVAHAILDKYMKYRPAVQLKETVLSSAGMGDGAYPVYVKTMDFGDGPLGGRRVVSLTIVFIDQNVVQETLAFNHWKNTKPGEFEKWVEENKDKPFGADEQQLEKEQ